MNFEEIVRLSGTASAGRRPGLVQRPPLVFPPAPHPYRDTLPWDPPLSRDFLRGDAWGITLEGAPFVPGGSSKYPQRMLSWFLDRYPLEWQWRYLETAASYGYTHVYLSLGDSMGPKNNGPLSPPGHEQTLAQLIETCDRVHSVISPRDDKPLSVHMMLGSKYFHPKDMRLPEYQAVIGPTYQALLRAGCLDEGDEVCPGWEWNLWNIPGAPTIDIHKWVGRLAHERGLTCWWHGAPHYTSWFEEGSDRFAFWNTLGRDVDGIDYQADPHWDIDDLQARAVDTLWQFGRAGNVHKFRMFEDIAVLQFDGHPAPGTGRPADEALGRARGYLMCCTIDNVHRTDARVWGYGNGGSMPDGSPL